MTKPMPPNAEPITHQEFARWITIQSFEPSWAQIERPGKSAINTRLFTTHDGTGVAIMSDGTTFKFAACPHDYEDETIGNCYHRLTCRTCGYVTHMDTSG